MEFKIGDNISKYFQIKKNEKYFIAEFKEEAKEIKIDNNKRISIPIVIQDRYLCIYSDRMSSNQSNSEFNIAGLRK